MSELKIEDYQPSKKTPVDGFAVVNREALLSLLDDILAGKGAEPWCVDAAKKIHFGLVHGLGTVADLVEQARAEERSKYFESLSDEDRLRMTEGSGAALARATAGATVITSSPTSSSDGEKGEGT